MNASSESGLCAIVISRISVAGSVDTNSSPKSWVRLAKMHCHSGRSSAWNAELNRGTCCSNSLIIEREKTSPTFHRARGHHDLDHLGENEPRQAECDRLGQRMG